MIFASQIQTKFSSPGACASYEGSKHNRAPTGTAIRRA
jgi:hypothetical protein